jgi:hypothetical protein
MEATCSDCAANVHAVQSLVAPLHFWLKNKNLQLLSITSQKPFGF